MNILGEGFPKEIIKQIEVRQEVYGSGYANGISRTNDQLVYLNANTAWCKLVSSTDIDKLHTINNPTIKQLNLKGTDLAKRFILFNGVQGQGEEQRSGITPNTKLLGNNNAYGIGGTDFGINPMMGIQTVSVTHENRGSLRTATVKLKAWNKTQLEIIDVLYLRLGFSVLLEWGNSMYYDDKGVLQTKQDNSLADIFLEPGAIDYNIFLALIKTRKIQSSGNYDAMFAKVKNFHWSFLKDGSYDVTIDLISSGDIIESLKINAIEEDHLDIEIKKILLGNQEINPFGIKFVPISDDLRDVNPALCKKGSYDLWKKAISVYERPNMELRAFGFFCAFGSLLMPFFKSTEKSAVINFYNPESGQGKSTILQTMTSVYGNPAMNANLIQLWGDTGNAVINRMGYMNNLPSAVDEFTKVTADQLHEFLKFMATGRGKNRMESNGKNKERNKKLRKDVLYFEAERVS